MKNILQEIEQLQEEFALCQKTFIALGDENRQRLLAIMMESKCKGSRVIEIAKKTHLSRPAVSHHMKILKDAGMVRIRKEGTKVYYYLNPSEDEINKMIILFSKIRKIIRSIPDRKEEKEALYSI